MGKRNARVKQFSTNKTFKGQIDESGDVFLDDPTGERSVLFKEEFKQIPMNAVYEVTVWADSTKDLTVLLSELKNAGYISDTNVEKLEEEV